jgi:hypothetical protein
MITKDYYAILGVSPMESPSGIREAFRELVKRYHPDRIGPQGTPVFQDIIEAYQVLSDPERRKLYNRGLRRAEGGVALQPTPVNGSSLTRWCPNLCQSCEAFRRSNPPLKLYLYDFYEILPVSEYPKENGLRPCRWKSSLLLMKRCTEGSYLLGSRSSLLVRSAAGLGVLGSFPVRIAESKGWSKKRRPCVSTSRRW